MFIFIGTTAIRSPFYVPHVDLTEQKKMSEDSLKGTLQLNTDVLLSQKPWRSLGIHTFMDEINISKWD